MFRQGWELEQRPENTEYVTLSNYFPAFANPDNAESLLTSEYIITACCSISSSGKCRTSVWQLLYTCLAIAVHRYVICQTPTMQCKCVGTKSLLSWLLHNQNERMVQNNEPQHSMRWRISILFTSVQDTLHPLYARPYRYEERLNHQLLCDSWHNHSSQR